MTFHEAENPRTSGHEPNVVDADRIWRAGAVLTAIVVVTLFLAQALSKWMGPTADESADSSREAAKSPLAAKGVPMLDAKQSAALARLRTIERDRLGGYAWVDETNSVARIPIERAIAIAAQHGLPARIGPSSTAKEPAR